MEKKNDPLYSLSSTGLRLYQRMSNALLAYAYRIQRMSSVSSVCLAYDERMSNVLSIRSHTLTIFEHVQNNNLASAYNNLHRRVPAYDECTRRMPSPNVNLRMRAYDHTLAFADAVHSSVTAL